MRKNRKRIICSILTVFLFMGLTITPAFAANLKAVPSAQKLTINGTVVDHIPVYNINGYNYFKLRDIAYYLDYEVEYLQASNAIAILRGGHGVNAGISKGKATSTVYGVASSQRIFIDMTDYSSQLHPVNIGGNNYFQLRELAQYAAYGVQFDPETNSILVDSNYTYSKDGLIFPKADSWKDKLAVSLAADKEIVKQKAAEAAKTPLKQWQEQKPVEMPVEVESVSLSQSYFIIETGETAQISASVKPDNAVNKTLTYTSHDPEIATVSDTRLIQAKAGGTAEITVTAANGKTATVYVSVNGYNYDDAKEVYRLVNEERAKHGFAAIDYFEEMQPVADIRAKEIVMQRGHDNKPAQFGRENLAYGYTSAEDVMYAWVYDDAESNWGHRDNILASDNRSIIVGCYWYNGHGYWSQNFWDGYDYSDFDRANSPATQKAREIFAQLNGQQQMMPDEPGQSQQGGGFEPTQTITTDLTLNQDTFVLEPYHSQKLLINQYPPNYYRDLTVKSSNPSIAECLPDGTVLGYHKGTAVITVTASNGLTASCTVTVTDRTLEPAYPSEDLIAEYTPWGILSTKGVAYVDITSEEDFVTKLYEVLEWDKDTHVVACVSGIFPTSVENYTIEQWDTTFAPLMNEIVEPDIEAKYRLDLISMGNYGNHVFDHVVLRGSWKYE